MAISIKGKGKAIARKRRHLRLRKKVVGTAARPRLVVTRSTRHITAQVVDDAVGRTLVSASTLEVDLRGAEGDKSAKARKVGEPHRRAREGRRHRGRRVRPRRQQVPRSRGRGRRRCPRGRPDAVTTTHVQTKKRIH